ncbi:hypothetical protein [Neptunicella sp.]|uniref:hypothetical protein n=1 Tax=Neptunicella sp. TaxID=2125986 RepID=UPI003F694486
MLLRSVIKQVQQQNWIAILIDFLIVVVGVFVGLQVTNWNEARIEEQQSEVFSQRLTHDLLEEAWNYQFLIEYYGDVLDNANRAVAVLEGRVEMSDETLLIAAYRATQYSLDTRMRSTYDELTATGKLDLIKSPLLRDTAMRIYNFSLFETIRSAGENSAYRQTFRMLIPIQLQERLLKQCGDHFVEILDYQHIVDSLDYDCQLHLPTDQISTAADLLRSNKQIVGALRLRYSQLQSNVASLTIYYPEIREGLRKIVDQQD